MKKTAVSAVLALVFLCSGALAQTNGELPRALIPGGHTVGIRLQTDGVIVIGFAPVTTKDGQKNPAKDGGLLLGDRIIRINGSGVGSAKELHEAVSASSGAVAAELIRKDETKNVELVPAVAAPSGERRLGVLIRDGMSGIGTMTFYDPASGLYGALGHGVNDADSGTLLPIETGDILPAVIKDVKAGRAGSPGELHGDFPDRRRCGDVRANTGGGIFGLLKDPERTGGFAGEAVPLAGPEQVRTGKAYILCNVRGGEVERFEIEIVRLYDRGDPARNLQLQVTDPALLEITGGIVQGMSGSPILQDGRLVGAVTHVLVNDPKRGYGIFIGNMLAEGYGRVEMDNHGELRETGQIAA